GNSAHRLYRNAGDGSFSEVVPAAGLTGLDLGQGWGGVWADYNNDGYLDLLANHVGWSWPFETGFYELFRNDGCCNHWLEIDLRGVTVNSRAYGARVWVRAGGQELFREVADGSHYFIHYAGPLHFGLGSAAKADIRIQWPNGDIQQFADVPVDQRVRISEGDTEILTTRWVFLPFIFR
ncbi:MAG TPA: CRTAC1 family protein, partial [Anaerolineaceae bacterium]|nr:CRTAC1 family protein [Anaerolineaceae bacterium]